MGKRSIQFEEEERSVRCKVCEDDIALDYYLDRGNLIKCEWCSSEFVIKSIQPVVLFLLDEEEDDYDDYYEEDYFEEEDFSGRAFD